MAREGDRRVVFAPDQSFRNKAKWYDQSVRVDSANHHKTKQKRLGEYVVLESEDKRHHIELKPGSPASAIRRIASIIWAHGQKNQSSILNEVRNGTEQSHGRIKNMSRKKLMRILNRASRSNNKSSYFVVVSDIEGGALDSDFWLHPRLGHVLSQLK